MTLTERRQAIEQQLRDTLGTESTMREALDQIHDQGQQLRGALSVLDQLIAIERTNGITPADTAAVEETIAGDPNA